MWLRLPPRRRKELIECARFLGKDAMRLFALALTLSLADFAAASATPPPCCAPAASGHATAAPPSSVMKSRRFNGSNCIECPPARPDP